MSCARTSTIVLLEWVLETAMKNLVRKMSRPRIEVTTITPMRKKDMCCDQKGTSNGHGIRTM